MSRPNFDCTKTIFQFIVDTAANLDKIKIYKICKKFTKRVDKVKHLIYNDYVNKNLLPKTTSACSVI